MAKLNILAKQFFGRSKMKRIKKVYDVFTYNGEEVLLEIRLRLLWDRVDLFVIAESNQSFSGVSKDLTLPSFIEKNPKYKPKVVYIPVLDMPEWAGDWCREAYQRYVLGKALHCVENEDYIMLSDADEIPNPMLIGALGVFKQQLFVYHLDTIAPYLWEGTVGLSGQQYLNVPDLERWRRGRLAMRRVWNAGWHLTYIGGASAVKNKIQSFSDSHIHNVYEESHIKDKIGALVWPFGRGEVQLQPMPCGWRPPFIPVKHLPDYVSYFYDKSRVI